MLPTTSSLKSYLSSALIALTVSQHVAGQSGASECVQFANAGAGNFSSCPCDDATLTFTLEGKTTIEANTVNVALVLDGSGSILASNWELEKEFAKDTVAAFADLNLFDNGGTASYVQFSSIVISSTSTTSLEEFNDFVDADVQSGGGTNIANGIDEATILLGSNEASLSFMIVITDGQSFSSGPSADAARDAGITVFAVGVGSGTDEDELEVIGGDPANVFSVDAFDELNDALVAAIISQEGSSIACTATGVTLTVEYSSPVTSASPSGASISGNTVVYTVADLEDTPTDFTASLDSCGAAPGSSVVTSIDYTDDQGNSPDLSALLDFEYVTCDQSVAPTPSPREILTFGPTLAPTTMGSTPMPVPIFPAPSPAPVPSSGGDCDVCSHLTSAQEEALASYDNGGKHIVCDPTCLDDVTDKIHCNYFGLGQICRGCGNCSDCTPCP